MAMVVLLCPFCCAPAVTDALVVTAEHDFVIEPGAGGDSCHVVHGTNYISACLSFWTVPAHNISACRQMEVFDVMRTDGPEERCRVTGADDIGRSQLSRCPTSCTQRQNRSLHILQKAPIRLLNAQALENAAWDVE